MSFQCRKHTTNLFHLNILQKLRKSTSGNSKDRTTYLSIIRHSLNRLCYCELTKTFTLSWRDFQSMINILHINSRKLHGPNRSGIEYLNESCNVFIIDRSIKSDYIFDLHDTNKAPFFSV
jgi:hypothetical protein